MCACRGNVEIVSGAKCLLVSTACSTSMLGRGIHASDEGSFVMAVGCKVMNNMVSERVQESL
jgi:hypothetical protein